MNELITMDALFKGQAFGNTAQRLLASGMNMSVLRPWVGGKYVADPHTMNPQGRFEASGNFMNVNGAAVPVANATLRKDEWKQYDTAILKSLQTRLKGVQDLYDAGLVLNIANGLGTTVLEYEDEGDVQGAQINMDGATRGQADRPEYTIHYMPLPIVHGDFQINIRALNASRTTGQALDTAIAELKSRKVAEKLEEMLFTDTTYAYGSGTIYSYLNHPHINTVTLAANWNASAKTGAQIITDVKNMKQALINARYYGPYKIYIPTAYETVLDADYVSGYPKTIRQRILEINNISGIDVIDTLTANNVLMVQMTPDVVRMVVGMPVSTVEWQTEGGMIFHYKVMTIQVPQIRSDASNRCGVCRLVA